MKHQSILKIMGAIGLVFWFLLVITMSVAVGLFVYSTNLRHECGVQIIDALQLFYDPN